MAGTQQAHQRHHGPPYSPQYQVLGEVPSIVPDVPVNAIFLVLFLLTGAGHGAVMLSALGKSKKFVISFVVVVFCVFRVIATSLRMAWACHPADWHLDIASIVFLYTGVVMLYLINLTLAQRILRAQHPNFGWLKTVSGAFVAVNVITILTLICIVAGVITSFYSRRLSGINSGREIEKFGSTMLAIVATLPLLIAGASSLARRHPHIRMTKTIDKFGEGTMRMKIIIVVVSSLLLMISAWFRAGVILMEPTPSRLANSRADSAPGYLSKACFYVFIFTMEILVCMLWLFARIHRRFHIPDGASVPFSYGNGFVFAGEPGNEKKRVSATLSTSANGSRPSSIRSGTSTRKTPGANDDVISPISKRSSWAASMTSQEKQAKMERLEARISWGGVSREDVRDTTDEQGKVLRYQPFAESWTGGDTAADVGVAGPEKELGFDAESGKWAVRPVSSMNSVRPSTSRSVIYEQ